MLKMRVKIKLVIVLCCVVFSCKTSQKVVYMQDAVNGIPKETGVYQGIIIQPKDVLSIIVSSRNPELAMSLNLPLQQYYAGSSEITSSYNNRQLGYQVDLEGYIDFPVVGRIRVAGLTRERLANMIKQRLQEDLIRDAIVTADFMNFKISVLGEVRSPGTFNVADDKITLLEALGKAGDLTIYGRRDNVLVRRETGGVVVFHRVNLLTEALLLSPAYYLQQNDVVYVEPNRVRAEQSGINEYRSVGVWISVAALLVSLSNLLIK
jgi:polysaccharide export outer membrane protein